jgi:predicted nucleic acid-binding protein
LILIDTSVWADHFRAADADVVRLIAARIVVMHPLVVEELALGHLPSRRETLAMLDRLPGLTCVDHDSLIRFVDAHGLAGSGIGVVDIHLLASSLAQGARLWARDKRLAVQAHGLGCGWSPPQV